MRPMQPHTAKGAKIGFSHAGSATTYESPIFTCDHLYRLHVKINSAIKNKNKKNYQTLARRCRHADPSSPPKPAAHHQSTRSVPPEHAYRRHNVGSTTPTVVCRPQSSPTPHPPPPTPAIVVGAVSAAPSTSHHHWHWILAGEDPLHRIRVGRRRRPPLSAATRSRPPSCRAIHSPTPTAPTWWRRGEKEMIEVNICRGRERWCGEKKLKW